MPRLASNERLFLIIPAAEAILGFCYIQRSGPVAALFAAFLLLTLAHCYIALQTLADRAISHRLRRLLICTSLLWFVARPSLTEVELYTLQEGMTVAETEQALSHWRSINADGRLNEGINFLSPQDNHCLPKQLCLTFDSDNRLFFIDATYP